MISRNAPVKRLAAALLLAACGGNAAAEWVVVNEHAEYIAYADPATISRSGSLVRMRDLIDLRSPRASPNGNAHASSTAQSEFDCEGPRMRTIAFSLHAGQMGNGALVETGAPAAGWLPVFAGTLLEILWRYACG